MEAPQLEPEEGDQREKPKQLGNQKLNDVLLEHKGIAFWTWMVTQSFRESEEYERFGEAEEGEQVIIVQVRQTLAFIWW